MGKETNEKKTGPTKGGDRSVLEGGVGVVNLNALLGLIKGLRRKGLGKNK